MNAKEHFFRTTLIPVAQLAELALYHVADKKLRKELSAVVMPPLNLVSVFVLNPEHTADLGKLKALLDRYAQALVAPLLVRYTARMNQTQRSLEFPAALTTMRRDLENLRDLLYAELGYRPAEHGLWLNQQMAVRTPLTQEGKPSKWRTLVRNTDLTLALKHYGLERFVIQLPSLGSRPGRDRLEHLWQEVFGTPNAEQAPSSKVSRNLLPSGVKVETLASGMLKVSARFDPKQFLVSNRTVVRATPPEALLKLQEPRAYAIECDYKSIAAAIEKALAWLQSEQLAVVPAMQKLHDRWAKEVQLSLLKSKIANTFSPEERELLAELYGKPLVA